jgi:hypothetical protein
MPKISPSIVPIINTNTTTNTNPPNAQTFSRRVTLADFMDEDDNDNTKNPNTNNKYNKNYSQNDANIQKNQQEFGHRKRIKP